MLPYCSKRRYGSEKRCFQGSLSRFRAPMFRDRGQNAARKAPVNLQGPCRPVAFARVMSVNRRWSSSIGGGRGSERSEHRWRREEGQRGRAIQPSKATTKDQAFPATRPTCVLYCTNKISNGGKVATNGYSKVQTRREEEEEEEETEREDAAESGFARPHPQPGMAKCNGQPGSAFGEWISYSRSRTNLY